jgi:NAD(P)-dependent dehydrogenase (short-subunit alcohol dehydrogenase family)
MDKKVMLITGASGGMGKALAEWFSERNDIQLILHANVHDSELIRGENIQHIKGDLSTQEGIQSIIQQVFSMVDRVDILINNAGISRSAMSWKQTQEDWQHTMAVNLDAPFFLIQAVLPGMRHSNFGRIVSISSVVAQTGAVGTAAYAASKAGLIGLTKTVAKEVATQGITVNALALGYFDTGMIADVPDQSLQHVIDTIPVGRLGTTDSVCSTIDWLISEPASYVTGQVINLNGGMY